MYAAVASGVGQDFLDNAWPREVILKHMHALFPLMHFFPVIAPVSAS